MVTVTIIPLNGYQKYGYINMNQVGSLGEMFVKYGMIDRCTKESMINKQSQTARLKLMYAINFVYFVYIVGFEN